MSGGWGSGGRDGHTGGLQLRGGTACVSTRVWDQLQGSRLGIASRQQSLQPHRGIGSPGHAWLCSWTEQHVAVGRTWGLSLLVVSKQKLQLFLGDAYHKTLHNSGLGCFSSLVAVCVVAALSLTVATAKQQGCSASGVAGFTCICSKGSLGDLKEVGELVNVSAALESYVYGLRPHELLLGQVWESGSIPVQVTVPAVTRHQRKCAARVQTVPFLCNFILCRHCSTGTFKWIF